MIIQSNKCHFNICILVSQCINFVIMTLQELSEGKGMFGYAMVYGSYFFSLKSLVGIDCYQLCFFIKLRCFWKNSKNARFVIINSGS